MTKARICFCKKGFSKYISHLDLMKLFQRVFKIANVDIAYSEGYNPHPKMSIGNPLPLGASSDMEFMDITLNTNQDFNTIAESMNRCLPEGIKVLKVSVPDLPLNSVKKSEYTIKIHLLKPLEHFKDYFNALKTKDDIVISKKTKSGYSNVDIKPFIYRLEIIEINDEIITLNAVLATGEPMNLKAMAVIDSFVKYIPNFEYEYTDINRNAMFDANNVKFTN